MVDRDMPPGGLPVEDLETRRLRAECARELFGDAAPDLMRIGRFTLISQLGAGGQGAVYVAEDPELHRKVALKRLAVTDESHRQRLRTEGQALAKISHSNVVTVYEVGEDETGQPFLVMELVDGVPLHVWLRQEPRPWSQIVDLLLDVGEGLAALHRAGVVHRDVKPHNIVIADDARAKLVDLGIAMLEPEGVTDEEGSSTSTMPGTVGYMAPEHRSGRADSRSDQFSFCVTLFEALYGVRPPWSMTLAGGLLRPSPPSSTSPEVLARVWGSRTHRRAPVPRGLIQVLGRGLQRDPSSRYADMSKLLGALRRVRRPRKTVPLLAALLGLTAAGLGAAVAASGAPPSPCDDLQPTHRSWHEHASESVKTAFEQTGSPLAGPTFATVDVMLGDAANELDQRLGEACRDDGTTRDLTELADIQSRQGMFQALVESLTTVNAADLAGVPLRLSSSLQRLREPGSADACERTRAILEPTTSLRLIEEQQQHALAAGVAGRHEEALALTDEALSLAGAKELESVRARLHLIRGRLALEAQRYDIAREQLERARSLAETLGCDSLGAQALALWAKAQVLDPHGSASEAEQASRMALDKVQRMDLKGLRRAEVLNSRGVVLQRRHDHEGAVNHFREAIEILSFQGPTGALDGAKAMLNLSNSQARLGDIEASIETLEHARAQWANALWDEHPSLYKVYANLSHRHRERGDLPAARRYLDEALVLAAAGLGAQSPSVARLHIAMAQLLDLQHEFDAALTHATKADRIFVANYGEDDVRRLTALEAMGVVCMDAGWIDRAIPILEHALEVRRESGTTDIRRSSIGRGKLAQAHARRGDYEMALVLFEEARLPFSADPMLRSDRFYPELLLGHGEALLGLDRDLDAIAPLREAAELWAERGDNPERLAHTRWLLAQSSCSTDAREAIGQARLALDYFEVQDYDGAREIRTRIQDWIRSSCIE